MELPEERTLGGDSEPGTGQDVTIILVPKAGSRHQKLALIHLHSHVLSTHSKYFNTCLSERWKKPASPSTLIEFVLEVQTDVQYYFDCFSNMYSPFVKNFKGVKHGVELLKVASQIEFQQLMERISFYLSSLFWSEEDEIRVREYSASPDFPRIHLKDLVARLGLGESKEDRQMQLCALARQYARGVFKASSNQVVLLPAFLQGIGCGLPSDYSRMVTAIVSQEAKDMFVDIGKDWNGKIPGNSNTSYIKTTRERIQIMYWALKAFLRGEVAEELVQGIVHLDAIPNYVSKITDSSSLAVTQRFAELVLLMYQEVVAGRLLLRSPERMALLANWHVVMKTSLNAGSFEETTRNLFMTLPLKQQAEFINLRKEKVCDYISIISLIPVLRFHKGLGQAGS